MAATLPLHPRDNVDQQALSDVAQSPGAEQTALRDSVAQDTAVQPQPLAPQPQPLPPQPQAQPQPLLQSRPQAQAQPLLTVRDLTLEYASADRLVRATQRVSFDVYRGERFVLLGASGCGKSSLLKAVAGFIEPREGEVRLEGERVREPGPDRVVVFQEFDQLPPWKTVLGNVAFPLLASRRASRRAAREQALQALSTVGLADFATAYPHQLSGGMKQRVAIARALVMQPKVLLMDEPFAALDALTRRRMQQELISLWRQWGFTLLFITHSIDEALVVGSRILVLSPRPGRVRAELNAHAFDLEHQGSPAFQAQAQRIHRLLFEDAP